MKKCILMICGMGCAAITMANTVANDSPAVVRNAEYREAMRQDSTWTSENIQKNPYLFLRDQIASCDKLKAKIDAQNITLIRMEKQANRMSEEAEEALARYNKFLADAKVSYKVARASGKWPIVVNGYKMDEEQLRDRIADALERVELSKKEKVDNEAITQKVRIRKGTLKTKKHELTVLRRKLVQQAEQVKMNSALAEIGSLKDVIGTIKDMMLEIEEDPTKLSVEDLTAEDSNGKRNKVVNAFLNN